jgi:hypothetical protein
MRSVGHAEEETDLKDFTKPIPQPVLDIEEKNRSNLFAWRGQFSPQLIECLLEAYCPADAVMLDSFAGSGTVLYEAATMSLAAFGFEINPSAWGFSKLYQFANVPPDARDTPLTELRRRVEAEFPIIIFSDAEIMMAIRQIQTVTSGAVTVTFAPEFDAKQVEILISPIDDVQAGAQQLRDLLLAAPALTDDGLQTFDNVRMGEATR